ncbi:ribosome biosynthesis protein nip7 [Aspergillus nanangensis]|uniref:60S ribosome subunit biogenesis protein NIP7 n=1 Tax=Aspergillus nanangensis TaxID=2582783 RepID=A0AAD4GX21_ASPNN|nr:ribosome biosynthesis protein nip7 [Aspergillus nanangensis]
MRQLTEEETKTMLSKLANYCGRNINNLIVGSDDSDPSVFRLHGNRVYYLKSSLANLSTAIPRANLLTLGTCLGKFTKGGAFRIHITALDIIAPVCRYKAFIKDNGVMPFLYGGNCVKAHIGRWSDDVPELAGVVVVDMHDNPLGFGISKVSSAASKNIAPTDTVIFSQADIGQYLREEDTLFTT